MFLIIITKTEQEHSPAYDYHSQPGGSYTSVTRTYIERFTNQNGVESWLKANPNANYELFDAKPVKVEKKLSFSFLE